MTPGTHLFDASPYRFVDAGRNHDVSTDGQRFVLVKNPPGFSGAFSVVVALNWIEQLSRGAPVACS